MTPDTPPFELLPGAAHSPVILHVPHSAREIPAEVRAGIVLDDAALERELDHITDAHTAELARCRGAAVRRDAVAVREPALAAGRRSGALPGRAGGDARRRDGRGLHPDHSPGRLRPADTDPEPLIDRYFRPYARAMTEAVADRLAATGRAVIIDVHSYPSAPLPYELHGDGPPPAGLPRHRLLPHPARAARRRPARRSRGAGRPGSTARSAGRTCRWSSTARSRAVGALMVEIRRDTYMTEPGGRPPARESPGSPRR